MALKKKYTFISIALIAISFNAASSDLIFKCDIKNNKQVSLYKDFNTVIYSFGKVNSKPDIELKRKNNLGSI